MKKDQLERREPPRVALQDNLAVKAGRDPVRKGRTSMRLKPVVDQRFDGMSKESVEQD